LLDRTAEPHFLVHAPSRMVVMENLAPAELRDAQLETSKIQYSEQPAIIFAIRRVPQIAESDFRDIPVALLGARQAITLRGLPELNRCVKTNCALLRPISNRQNQPFVCVNLIEKSTFLRGRRISSGAKAKTWHWCAELRANVVKILSVATLLSARLKKNAASANQEITRVQRELDNERTHANLLSVIR